MNEPTPAQLLLIIGLLEERHGVGVRGGELPRWLAERLRNAVLALMREHQVGADELMRSLRADPELALELANALRVGETRFYRDAPQWEALRRQVVPRLLAARGNAPVLALSAGCSTGEEAWTLAMLLAEGGSRGANRPRPRVLGVDRSEAALVTARAAAYDVESQRQLPAELARRFLAPAVDGSLRVTPELQAAVSFKAHDLTHGVPAGRYAIIVCKNVLIYFGAEAQQRVTSELLRCLSDDGVLLVARSEVPIVRNLAARSFEIAPGITVFGP